MSWWMALDGRRRTFVLVTAAVVLVSIAYALNIRFVLAGPQAVTAIDDIGEAVAAAVASPALVLAARGGSRRGAFPVAAVSPLPTPPRPCWAGLGRLSAGGRA